MFPPVPTAPARPSRTLRRRLVRGLDVAVEFVTLGEYGVEEVELAPMEPAPCSWDWPPRRSGRGRALTARSRGGCAAAVACA